MSENRILDVAIVGGGIVGLSSALELQSRGRTVAVIDPGEEERRASFGNAGVLSRGSILPVAGPGVWRNLLRYARGADPAVRIRYSDLPGLSSWLRLFLSHANEPAWRRSASALNGLVAGAYARHLALGAVAGTLPLIRREGWLRLYRNADTYAGSALERNILKASGVAVELLEGDGIYQLEPAIARRYSHALLFPETGAVDSPGELIRRFEAAVRGRGGVFIQAHANDLRQTDDGVEVRTGNQIIRAHSAVLSTGAWAGELSRRLGYRIPFAAERGYHVHYRLKAGARLNRPINDTTGGYAVAPMGDTVRILSGVELGRPEGRPNYSQINSVVADVAKTLPLSERLDGAIWQGNRPSTPDSLPLIGFAPRHPRIVFAFGHGHIGFSTGPITGEIVARLVCAEPQEIPIEPFDPGRFSGARPVTRP